MARNRKARINGNGHGKPSWHSGNWNGPWPMHQPCTILIRASRSFSKRTRVDSRLLAASISRMFSGFSGQCNSTPGDALKMNRITTPMFGSYWPFCNDENSGGTTSRVPIWMSLSGVLTRISSTSRHPKNSPEDKPGGRKFFGFKT